MIDKRELLMHLLEIEELYKTRPSFLFGHCEEMSKAAYSPSCEDRMALLEKAEKSFSKKGLRDFCLDFEKNTNGCLNIDNVFDRMSVCSKRLYEKADCSTYKGLLPNYMGAKIVIVGTITPHNGKGFFYTAPRTKMYEIIDKLLSTTLDSNKDNKEELIKQLNKNGICFIDVFSKVIRRKESASDDDILYGSLNYSGFKECVSQIGENTLIVANSKLAHELCQKILKCVNDGNSFGKLEEKSHTIFRKSVDVLAKDWKTVFEKAGFKVVP